MLKIFGCPMSCGVGTKGSGITHSIEFLQEHYKDLDITVIPEVIKEEENLENLKNLNSVIATCDAIARYSYDHILKNGDMPVFIGGDHAAAMGTVSAAGVYHKEIGLIWVDAHPDINTDATSVTGNIHGMPVAALLGKGEKSLTRFLTDDVKVKPENVVMIGLRDIDPPEAVTLKELNIKYYTYDDVKRRGLDECLDESVKYLSHLKNVHISFDLDSTNPQILPGVSVPVEDGFTLPEIYKVFDRYLNDLPVTSLDIVEFNAELDKEKKTSDFLMEFLEYVKEVYSK